ncbi:MAG: bifunctional hydroxymethylpyrimidine kinase/phosphomethylpyrimidine kinase [Cellvibrio sp.]|nr:bifunctional hydroxymethylpyrimidine kinase/phosphomethylpyrimidine kinase [Cellvibrio sp.]
MNSNPVTPIALTIAGSDSGGGAGIQADLKTFSALGVFGCSTITSLTAQNTLGVQGVFAVPPEFVQQQIQSVMSDLQVGAIKTGMLANAGIISAVADSLKNYPLVPFVLDPVMIATSGDRLLTEDAIENLIKDLLPLATVITPNLHEAAALLNQSLATDRKAMQEQGEKILSLGAKAVLMKGGHATDEQATDLLITQSGTVVFSAPRLQTKNTHGTGCTLASAIAAGLAKKLSLQDAVKQAKDYLQGALAASNQLRIGNGSGPVHHFFKFY